ncbi:MAG TPA: hypothetical protein VLJ15_02295 [Gammaproteobacteria bacterium]|nr:hypothetical protein [Gammaproteobacteria bacterium]
MNSGRRQTPPRFRSDLWQIPVEAAPIRFNRIGSGGEKQDGSPCDVMLAASAPVESVTALDEAAAHDDDSLLSRERTRAFSR